MITREDTSEHSIVYHFIGTLENSECDQMEEMVIEGMREAYTVTLDLSNLEYIGHKALDLLQHLYVLSIGLSCELFIITGGIQPAIMLEVLQIDKLYDNK